MGIGRDRVASGVRFFFAVFLPLASETDGMWENRNWERRFFVLRAGIVYCPASSHGSKSTWSRGMIHL